MEKFMPDPKTEPAMKGARKTNVVPSRRHKCRVLGQTRAESAQRSSVWVKSRAERQRYWMSRKVKQSLAAQLRLKNI